MNQEKKEFLNLLHFPGVVDREQAGWRAGFSPEEIDIIANTGKLTVLGKPKKNGKKVFAMIEIERCIQDMDWMNRAQRAIIDFWSKKNQSRRKKDAVASAPTDKTMDAVSLSSNQISAQGTRNSKKQVVGQSRNGSGADFNGSTEANIHKP